jgi:hypothetical protein
MKNWKKFWGLDDPRELVLDLIGIVVIGIGALSIWAIITL